MSKEAEIQIYNFIEDLPDNYIINRLQKITKDNKKITLEDNDKNKIIIHIKISENFILMCYVKKNNKSSNDKKVFLNAFGITIIKIPEKDATKIEQQININIPFKVEKVISEEVFRNLKFFFHDYIEINKEKNYLIIYIFNQLHIFKIYEKDDNLKYKRDNLKNFENKENFQVMYLGSKKNIEDIEIGLLLKPENKFLFISIDINDKNGKIKEKEYSIDSIKYQNILNVFKGSYCNKFIFQEKETNKKYILSKDNINKQMLVQEIEINHIWNNNPKGNEFYYLYNINDKYYILADISEKIEEPNNNKKNEILFGIYEMTLDKEIDKYKINLIQQIRILNVSIEKNLFININVDNCISIDSGEFLFFIKLKEKGVVDSINQIKTNWAFSRIYFEKFKNNIILIICTEDKLYLSKIIDNYKEHGKCFVKNNQKNNIKIEDNKKENEISEQHNEIVHDEIEYSNNKETDDEINKKENDNENESKLKELINQIIEDKINMNKKMFELFKRDYEEKLDMMQKENELVREKNEQLEKYTIPNMLKKINKLEEIKERDNKYNEEEEEEQEQEINKKYNNKNNNYKEINKNNYMNNNKYNYNNIIYNNQMNKNNTNNIPYNINNQMNQNNIINNIPNFNYNPINQQQFNQQPIINQYNLGNNRQNMPNMIYNNNLNLNDPRIAQFLLYLQNQQLHK